MSAHSALDRFGWRPTFPAAKSLPSAGLVASQHLDCSCPQMTSPLLRAVVSKALSKSFYGQAAAPTFCKNAVPTHRSPCGAREKGQKGGSGKDHSRLFMTARGQCHLEKKPAVLPPMVASIEGSFEARPRRLAPCGAAPSLQTCTCWRLCVGSPPRKCTSAR